MPHVADARIVDFDADRVVEEMRAEVGEYLGSVAEYDRDDTHLLYASNLVVSFFEGVDGVEEFADSFHDHAAHDFYERELFEDLVPMSNEVNGFVTRMDGALLIRYLVGDQGLFVSTAPNAPLDTIFDVLDRTV